jgi:BON domain
MRPTLLFAICLLVGAACAHKQNPVPEAASAREPGTVEVVPVAAAPQTAGDAPAAESSAALVQSPEPTAPKPSSDPLLGPTADASGQPEIRVAPPTAEEVRLRERIQTELGQQTTLSFTAKHVSVEVDRSDVTLEGDVRTAREKSDVQAIVEKIQGVRRVHNKLAVRDATPPARDALR